MSYRLRRAKRKPLASSFGNRGARSTSRETRCCATLVRLDDEEHVLLLVMHHRF